MPPPRPLINSSFSCHQKTGENRVFRFLCSPFSAHFSLVGVFFLSPPKTYPQGFVELRRGGQKTGENKFFGCPVTVFFVPFGLLMVTFRLHVPCSLQMCHSTWFSYFRRFVFLLLGSCVLLFLSIFVFIVFLLLMLLLLFPAFSLGVTKTQIKSQSI